MKLVLLFSSRPRGVVNFYGGTKIDERTRSGCVCGLGEVHRPLSTRSIKGEKGSAKQSPIAKNAQVLHYKIKKKKRYIQQTISS